MQSPKPQNLPVYVYHLPANVILVKDGIGYEIRAYSFADVIIKSNHALRPGDCLTMSSVYPGNEYTEIIPHLQKKTYLSGAAEELKHYYGCQVVTLAHGFVDPDSDFSYSTNGSGRCRIFIELSASKLADDFHKLDRSFTDYNELSELEKAKYDKLKEEYYASDDIEYWKTRIKKWDTELTCIGKVPEDLIY